MAVECVFFDLDDCLYKNDWATMDRISARVGEYCTQMLGLPVGTDCRLYKTYGTTVCGLVREQLLEERRVGEFLEFAHDVPLGDVRPDPRLRAMLQAIPHPLWVFTASIRRHAERCLKRLGIQDLFLGIISASSRDMVNRAGYVTKHDRRCFLAAMDFAGISPARASGCILLDDSPKNLRTAKELGWRTVLVGLEARGGSRVLCPHADIAVGAVHEILTAVPELFSSGTLTRSCRGLVPAGGEAGLAAVPAKQQEQHCAPWGCLGTSSASDTESTSAGEELVEAAAKHLIAGQKRRRLAPQCLSPPSPMTEENF